MEVNFQSQGFSLGLRVWILTLYILPIYYIYYGLCCDCYCSLFDLLLQWEFHKGRAFSVLFTDVSHAPRTELIVDINIHCNSVFGHNWSKWWTCYKALSTFYLESLDSLFLVIAHHCSSGLQVEAETARVLWPFRLLSHTQDLSTVPFLMGSSSYASGMPTPEP